LFYSVLAIAWWKTDVYGLLLGHYGLSLVGVIFDGYFLYLQVFVIKAVCIWCVTYEHLAATPFPDRVRGLRPAAETANGGVRRWLSRKRE